MAKNKQWHTRRANMARLVEHLSQRELADLTGRSEAQVYQMSKAEGKNARPVSEEVGDAVEIALDLGAGWFDIPDAPMPNTKPRAAARENGARAAATMQQTIERLQGDVDQLRLALSAVVAWATGSIPGAGDVLEELLVKDVDRYYAEHGFHGLLLELIGRIRATAVTAPASSEPRAADARRRQSR